MRVSSMLNNPNFFDDTELIFFHGTSTKHRDTFVKQGVSIPKNKRNKKKDFGQGFYLTTNYWQAKRYAKKICEALGGDPLVISCTILLGKLREELPNGYIIDEFNLEWLETIVQGRFYSKEYPLTEKYEWIYGRCGDGQTYRFDKMFQRDPDQDLNNLLPHIIPKEERPHYSYDQLWLGTKKAINFIQTVEFTHKEGNYYEIPHHR